MKFKKRSKRPSSTEKFIKCLNKAINVKNLKREHKQKLFQDLLACCEEIASTIPEISTQKNEAGDFLIEYCPNILAEIKNKSKMKSTILFIIHVDGEAELMAKQSAKGKNFKNKSVPRPLKGKVSILGKQFCSKFAA